MTTKKTEPEPFTLDGSAPLGVGRVGTLHAAPADIVRAFGPANVGASGDNKVDREWLFRSREGHGVSVYAYKATSLYDADLPSPSDFWSSEDVYRGLSVSGPNERVGEAFIKWAQAKIAETKQAEPVSPQPPKRCATCGGFNLRGTAWVWLNTGALCENTDAPTDEVWCEDCEDETEIAE